MRDHPWSVPVAHCDVPETGRHLDLAADDAVRTAVARLAGLVALPRLEAGFDVTPRGSGGLHVVGRVSATVVQTCVVTLEPVENEVAEEIDLVFAPVPQYPLVEGKEVEVPVDEAPEALVDGTVDLGAIATEFLLLGIDPYPRKPGAVFEVPSAGGGASHPFAALAALKKEPGGNVG